MAENVKTSSELLRDLWAKRPEEAMRTRKRLALVSAMPDSMQNRMVSSLTNDCFQRATVYAETGKLPEDIEQEKEKEERHRALPWLLVIILGLMLALTVLRHHGITFDCDDPDVVLGGCNDR
jgi:hypothetical protein